MYSFNIPNSINASKAFLCCSTDITPSYPKVNTIFLPFEDDRAAGGVAGEGELHILPKTLPSRISRRSVSSDKFRELSCFEAKCTQNCCKWLNAVETVAILKAATP